MKTHEKLYREKESLMREMLECLSKWDDPKDEVIEILERNKQLIQSMQKIDQQLTIEQLSEYNRRHGITWQEIIIKQQKLVNSVLAQKEEVQNHLVQIGQKDKVITNYIDFQSNAVFVEKDY